MANGLPNFTDEKVLASFLDLMGSTLTVVLQEIRDEGNLTVQGASDLCKVHQILARMRDACGEGTEWHRANLAFYTLNHMVNAQQEERDYIAKKDIPRNQKSKNRPSIQEVAEQILADLDRD
jgi:hypothetical protein